MTVIPGINMECLGQVINLLNLPHHRAHDDVTVMTSETKRNETIKKDNYVQNTPRALQ